MFLVKVAGGEHGKGFGPSVMKAVEDFLAANLLGEEQELADGVVEAGE